MQFIDTSFSEKNKRVPSHTLKSFYIAYYRTFSNNMFEYVPSREAIRSDCGCGSDEKCKLAKT